MLTNLTYVRNFTLPPSFKIKIYSHEGIHQKDLPPFSPGCPSGKCDSKDSNGKLIAAFEPQGKKTGLGLT
jgi:hypothetical protein